MKDALIIVDVQNDFVEGGALACAGGKALVPRINDLVTMLKPELVVSTQDWHPEHTAHFDKWPRHCVAGTDGAALVNGLELLPTRRFFKGQGIQDDGYSGFEGTTESGASLDSILRIRGITTVHIVGIATDYCVKATAMEACWKGYTTLVWYDFTVPVTAAGGKQAMGEMMDSGVFMVSSTRP